jgi:hypothetical protein
MTKMSINSHDTSGWLRVRMLNSKVVESLPDYLQVEFEGTRVNIPPSTPSTRATEIRGLQTGKTYVLGNLGSGEKYHDASDPKGTERDFFTILEGTHKGKKASVKTRGKNSSWFQPAHSHGSAHLIFKMETDASNGLTWGTLSFSGESVKAFTETRERPVQGTHELRIPDAPHSGGQSYSGLCKSPMTWFRIGNNGDRYVHPGLRSGGCITVLPEYWNRVYDYLINSRRGDLQNVGTVEVVYIPR